MITQEQLENRKLGIGGSDVAALFGVDPFNSIMDIYRAKTSPTSIKKKSLQMEIGGFLEAFVADKYQEIYPELTLLEPDTFIHAEKNYYRINIDRLIKESGAILEIKTANVFQKKHWGVSGSAFYPNNYKLQIAYYCAVIDAPYADLICLFGNDEIRLYRYDRDYQFEKDILNAVDNFWNNYVLKKIPPTSTIKEIVFNNPKKDHEIEENFVISSEIMDIYYRDLVEIKKNLRALETEFELVKGTILNYMNDKPYLVNTKGQTLITYKNKSRKIFDSDSFSKEYPELYKKYLTKTSEVKTFKIEKI